MFSAPINKLRIQLKTKSFPDFNLLSNTIIEQPKTRPIGKRFAEFERAFYTPIDLALDYAELMLNIFSQF
ncbi:hypothetical protein LEP1GSC088_2988 [Leptospira interrogans str. L1207]|nr:hypothetical protein LEP1GSC088_2988 [Leptospira interrogans str. L1207]